MIVTGPLMSASERDQVKTEVGNRPKTVVLDYVPDLPRYMAAARVVVSMCGYNTAAELVGLGVRSIVVPRTWRYGEHLKRASARAEWEQLMRAQALSSLGLVDMLEPESLTPKRLADRITLALARPRSEPNTAMDMRGLELVTDHILTLARDREGSAGVAG